MPNRLELLADNRAFLVCSFLILSFVLIGLFSPYFVRNPRDFAGDTYEPPTWEFKLGTDNFGRDVFAQTMVGIRYSLVVAALAGGIGMLIAILTGALGAYTGGLVDEGSNAVQNVFLTFPSIPLLIVLSSTLEYRSLVLVAGIIAITNWAGPARSIRSQVLSLKNRNFVNLAKITGASHSSILVKEILPNMLAYIFINFCGLLGGAITAEAGISLLGLGPGNIITLGQMLHWAISIGAVSDGIWWWYIPPGVVLVILTGVLIALGSVIDDILNPRLRGALESRQI